MNKPKSDTDEKCCHKMLCYLLRKPIHSMARISKIDTWFSVLAALLPHLL